MDSKMIKSHGTTTILTVGVLCKQSNAFTGSQSSQLAHSKTGVVRERLLSQNCTQADHFLFSLAILEDFFNALASAAVAAPAFTFEVPSATS